MLLNAKMPTIVGILTFMSMINFVLSSVEYEKSFITSRPYLVFAIHQHFMNHRFDNKKEIKRKCKKSKRLEFRT